jgi:pimeloyl-ACP methyl ester carboxylesterase
MKHILIHKGVRRIMSHQEFELTIEGFRSYYRILKCDNELYPPIIFLSGAFQTMDSWDKFVTYFKDKTTLILADLPGVGKADYLPQDFDLDFLAICVRHIVKHVSIPKVNVFSASYGSPIGYQFAKKYPNRVSHLLLGGIMREIPIESEASIYRSFDLLEENRMNEFAELGLKTLLCLDPNKEVYKSKVVARMLKKQLLHLNESQIEKYVGNTLRLFKHTPLNIDDSPDVPTLVLTGEHDIFTKPEYCREIASSFKNAAYTTIKNADHLCHMEQFDVVVELIDRFFSDKTLEDVPGCNGIEHFKQ